MCLEGFGTLNISENIFFIIKTIYKFVSMRDHFNEHYKNSSYGVVMLSCSNYLNQKDMGSLLL